MTSLLLAKILLPVVNILEENVDELTRLDSATGDGDHGVTIKKIAGTIKEKMNSLKGEEDCTDLLEDLSWDLMNVNGGSAGPLWGAFFEGMSEGANKDFSSDEEFICSILIGGYENFKDISKAKVGDKTMMDAIYPATDILKTSTKPFNEKIKDMAKAAHEGALKTTDMIAKFGRARSLKEGSLGHKDPGAVSFSLFYKGIAKGLE